MGEPALLEVVAVAEEGVGLAEFGLVLDGIGPGGFLAVIEGAIEVGGRAGPGRLVAVSALANRIH
jgi:hypothetical protein